MLLKYLGGLRVHRTLPGRIFCTSANGITWTQPEGTDTGIKIYNTATKSKLPLILPRDGIIKWFVVYAGIMVLSVRIFFWVWLTSTNIGTGGWFHQTSEVIQDFNVLKIAHLIVL